MAPWKSSTPYMDAALSPRSANGLIHPMIFPGGTDSNGNPLFFPVIPPGEAPNDPMLFEQDFRPGGRYYGRIFYASGLYPHLFGITPCGFTVPFFPGDVRFQNPLFNLPALSAAIRRDGLPPVCRAAAVDTTAALMQAGAVPALPLETDSEDDDTLHLPNAKGQPVQVCNCNLRVVSLLCDVDESGSSFKVELQLIRREKTYSITVPEKDLLRLSEVLGKCFPWFHLSAEPHAAAMLDAHIRDQLDIAPMKTIYRSAGWQLVEGRHIFVHDGIPASGSVSFQCEHTIAIDPLLSSTKAFRSALEILNIGVHEVTLPLFLTALAGPLFAIFQDAGYPPRFSAFLNGLSGSLKSAVAEVFANIYGERDHSTFRDTPAAIDVNVGKHRDRMLLVDDFQPPVVAAEGQAMRKTLEHLIRIFGDDIAKQRSNSTATATRGIRPRGSCLITGESISGSYSSLLRCLLVPISRGDIDGTRLRRYQESPALWTSNYASFLPWVGDNWDSLVEVIRASFPSKRVLFSQATPEPRLADTGAVLYLTGEIFLEYGVACGAISNETRQELLTEWAAVLCSLLAASSSASQELDIPTLSREAINNALAAGTLKIAVDADSFTAGMDGFYTADRLWLRQQPFSRVLRQQVESTQSSCVLNPKAVLPELYVNGLIVRDEETGKGSYLKRAPLIPALNKRPRMIAFILDELFRED